MDILTRNRFLLSSGKNILLSSVCSFMSSMPAPSNSFLRRHWYARTSLLPSAIDSFVFLVGVVFVDSYYQIKINSV